MLTTAELSALAAHQRRLADRELLWGHIAIAERLANLADDLREALS